MCGTRNGVSSVRQQKSVGDKQALLGQPFAGELVSERGLEMIVMSRTFVADYEFFDVERNSASGSEHRVQDGRLEEKGGGKESG